MRKKTRPPAVASSGNVFADLGLPNPEQELLKARLTLQVYKIVKARGLTQAQAGEVLGIKQPHVSALIQTPSRYFFAFLLSWLWRITSSKRSFPRSALMIRWQDAYCELR